MLAVLPFDNLSSDAETDYFSDGVSEDILGRIQRVSRQSAIFLKMWVEIGKLAR